MQIAWLSLSHFYRLLSDTSLGTVAAQAIEEPYVLKEKLQRNFAFKRAHRNCDRTLD